VNTEKVNLPERL